VNNKDFQHPNMNRLELKKPHTPVVNYCIVPTLKFYPKNNKNTPLTPQALSGKWHPKKVPFNSATPPGSEGAWLFETFPASRESLALASEWNSMSEFRQFQVRAGTPIIQGRAAAQGPYLPGGQMQKFILEWKGGLIQP
jgi:hypothetical protein